MCGIFCSISRRDCVAPSSEIQALLCARGPDATNTVRLLAALRGGRPHGSWLTFHSTVLSLRGAKATEQPYQSGADGPILCWNGEAWSINNAPIEGSDTANVHQVLTAAMRQADSERAESHDAVANALAKISGPYAFAFYDHQRSILFFGRDFLGRRSLLYRITERGDVLLSSVSDGLRGHEQTWREVEADGVYCIDLNEQAVQTMHCELQHNPSTWGDFRVYRKSYVTKGSSGGLASVGLGMSKRVDRAYNLVGTSRALAQQASLSFVVRNRHRRLRCERVGKTSKCIRISKSSRCS